MRLKSVFLAIVLMGLLTSPAFAAGRWGHGNWYGPIAMHRGNSTVWQRLGLDILLASGVTTPGQADPRDTVTPPGGATQAAVACSNRPSNWAGPITHSNWVSLQADCTTNLSGGTNYTYSTTFNLPAVRPGVGIVGRVLADDSVTIQLNGHTIMAAGGNLGAASTFYSTDPTVFTAGTNTLTFTVYNVTGPSGLDYVAGIRTGGGPLFGHLGNHDPDDRGD